MVKRGEIWLVNLDPVVGSSARATRPCVVVSPTELNEQLQTVLLVPLSSTSKAAPFRVPVTHAGTKGSILIEQCTSTEKARLLRRVGSLSSGTLEKTLGTLRELFAD